MVKVRLTRVVRTLEDLTKVVRDFELTINGCIADVVSRWTTRHPTAGIGATKTPRCLPGGLLWLSASRTRSRGFVGRYLAKSRYYITRFARLPDFSSIYNHANPLSTTSAHYTPPKLPNSISFLTELSKLLYILKPLPFSLPPIIPNLITSLLHNLAFLRPLHHPDHHDPPTLCPA